MCIALPTRFPAGLDVWIHYALHLDSACILGTISFHGQHDDGPLSHAPVRKQNTGQLPRPSQSHVGYGSSYRNFNDRYQVPPLSIVTTSVLYTCPLTLFNIVGPNILNWIFTSFGRRSHLATFACYMCPPPLSLQTSSQRAYLLLSFKSFAPVFRSSHLPVQTVGAC